jgi:hypothetical protein
MNLHESDGHLPVDQIQNMTVTATELKDRYHHAFKLEVYDILSTMYYLLLPRN